MRDYCSGKFLGVIMELGRGGGDIKLDLKCLTKFYFQGFTEFFPGLDMLEHCLLIKIERD